MKTNNRFIIFAVVLLAVGIVFAVPYLTPAAGPKKFEVTELPAEKLKQALDSGKPVFLEFYSGT